MAEAPVLPVEENEAAEIRAAADRAAINRRMAERQHAARVPDNLEKEIHVLDEEVEFNLHRQNVVGPPPAGPAEEMLRQFTQLLQRAANQAVQHQPPPPQQQPPRQRLSKFKVPQIDGTGAVEVFIDHFQQMAILQEWGAETVVLKAREGLKGKAQTCRQYDTSEAIAESLSLHFGLTHTEAGLKLNTLRRPHNQSLVELGTEVQRLTRIAYEDADDNLRQRLELEKFKLGLNESGLQGHLLARNPANLEEAIRMGSEYLQLTKRTQNQVREVETTNAQGSISPQDNLKLKHLERH